MEELNVRITINGRRATRAEQRYSQEIIDFLLGDPTPKEVARRTAIIKEAAVFVSSSTQPGEPTPQEQPAPQEQQSDVVALPEASPITLNGVTCVFPAAGEPVEQKEPKEPAVSKDQLECALVIVDNKSALADVGGKISELIGYFSTSISSARIKRYGFGCFCGPNPVEIVGGNLRPGSCISVGRLLRKLTWDTCVEEEFGNIWFNIYNIIDQALATGPKDGRWSVIVITDLSGVMLYNECLYIWWRVGNLLKKNPWLKFHFINMGKPQQDAAKTLGEVGKVYNYSDGDDITELAAAVEEAALE